MYVTLFQIRLRLLGQVNFYKFACRDLCSTWHAECLPFSFVSSTHTWVYIFRIRHLGLNFWGLWRWEVGPGRRFASVSVMSRSRQMHSMAIVVLSTWKLQECKFNLVNWNNLLHATSSLNSGRIKTQIQADFPAFHWFRLSIFFYILFLLASEIKGGGEFHMKYNILAPKHVNLGGSRVGLRLAALAAGNLFSIWWNCTSIHFVYWYINLLFLFFVRYCDFKKILWLICVQIETKAADQWIAVNEFN